MIGTNKDALNPLNLGKNKFNEPKTIEDFTHKIEGVFSLGHYASPDPVKALKCNYCEADRFQVGIEYECVVLKCKNCEYEVKL